LIHFIHQVVHNFSPPGSLEAHPATATDL